MYSRCDHQPYKKLGYTPEWIHIKQNYTTVYTHLPQAQSFTDTGTGTGTGHYCNAIRFIN